MTARPVPVILTERLKLRAHEAEDFDTLRALWSNEETVRHIGGKVRPAHEVWTNTLRNRGLWEVLGYGYWLVEDRRTGAFVGETGFADFHRDTKPPFWGVPEAGWIIAPDQHGKGYASEAVEAIHRWSDDELRPARTVCIIDPDNAPSLRIAQKLGYRQAGKVLFRGEEILFLERTGTAQSG